MYLGKNISNTTDQVVEPMNDIDSTQAKLETVYRFLERFCDFFGMKK